MPHIIINSRFNFDLIHSEFKGRVIRSTLDEGCIFNFKESFQNVSKDTILINTITIEPEFSQNYFVQLIKKSNQITVRLYPTTDPKNKTPNVKRSLALIAKTILESDTNGGSFIVRTNLQQYLEEQM
ncbi:hypothetical protein [Candidatus Nitrosocosmicus arcticus]|uniref:Uncharacterized protein n=1 Tax=Candidatus Nitrosocosmicus arcticus TaxID=2035267 RepID=A0A557ST88_9ARCH|nr:hypothetical protein [Candidatus Nitrosocosmicus arcticus]TVP39798.1 hypothetical protein NARC_110009 [Candidatus Nitrosocosmicus arcticus]